MKHNYKRITALAGSMALEIGRSYVTDMIINKLT